MTFTPGYEEVLVVARCRLCGLPVDMDGVRHRYGENSECLWGCNHEVQAGDEHSCGYCPPINGRTGESILPPAVLLDARHDGPDLTGPLG